MYKNFYDFTEMPFSQKDDCAPNSLYLSQNYTEALPLIVNGLDNKVTLSLVLGEAGVGKTCLINYLCDFFPQFFTAYLIYTPLDSSQDFFQKILTSLKLKVSKESTYEILLQLSFFLSTKFREQDNQSTIIIIDNADNMSLDALKGIELLLGLNAEGSQILQIILVGQPKLESLLNAPSLYALSQNTTTQYFIEPLTVEETQHYINHKINLVRKQTDEPDKVLFDEQACSMIYEYSKGNPSIINWICDKSLLRSSELKKHETNSELIFNVINDQVQISEKKKVPFLSPLALVTGLIFVGITLAFFLLPNFDAPLKKLAEESQTNHPTILEKSPAKEKSKAKKRNLAKIHQQKKIITKKPQSGITTKAAIKAQLAIAEQQITDLKFSTPEKDNAYETYTAILEANPREKRAIEGMKRITLFYLDRAKKQKMAGNLDKSQRSISKGLKVSPNHQELDKLEKQINIAKKLADRQNKIKVLFKQAEQQLDLLQFIKPPNSNAYKTYQDIIALDKKNSQAKYGILKILSQLKSQTQKALADKDYIRALEISDEILTLSSNEANNPFHKKTIIAAIETKKIIIINLLYLADEQWKEQKLTLPLGNNVFESYNTILQFFPNNNDAKKGLNKLKLKYQKSAKTALSAKKTDLALKIIDEGLHAFPSNEKLLALQNDVILQQTEIQKKAEDSNPVTKQNSKDIEEKLKTFGTF